ncbi:putative bifunctional diguanylate cyclase/phosphodiesterase [Asaia astilbis]
MSLSKQLQPQTAILEIARRLLSASSIRVSGHDGSNTLVDITQEGPDAGTGLSPASDANRDNEHPFSLTRTDNGYEFDLALDDELRLSATLPPNQNERELRELAHYLAVCARTIFRNQPQQTRRPDLPDRGLCAAHIEHMIESGAAEIRKTSFAVMKIDLDHLSTLNLQHGWETSNFIIDEAIGRIQDVLPRQAFLSYAGGGNFLVVSPPGLSLVTSRTLIATIRQALAVSIKVDDTEIQASFSIGWALYPDDGASTAALLQAVDAAMAEVRQHGGAHERRASLTSIAALVGTSGLERDLMQAIDRNELSLNWMPIIASGTQTVVALEALLRWERPGSGQVPPDMFIQCAENGGLIEKIDQWSLETACRTAVEWSHPLRVCVNISPTWLAKRHLSGMVEAILQQTGLAPERLQIELSEKRPFGPRDIAYQELSRLRALGVHVALDDFGAGYSSLERLANFPVDQIKFDRSFMQRLNDDRRVNEVMGQTIQMARRLGISCCAKGVETERQMAFLDSYGCEEVQGYLLGVPTEDYL